MSLRELAEKATPGPWGVGGGGRDICVRLGPDYLAHRIFDVGRAEDVRYIAAVSPDVVLALLDAIPEDPLTCCGECFWCGGDYHYGDDDEFFEGPRIIDHNPDCAWAKANDLRQAPRQARDPETTA